MKSKPMEYHKNTIVLSQENSLIMEGYLIIAALPKSYSYFLYSFSNRLISSDNSLPLSFILIFFLNIGIIHQACRPTKHNIRNIKAGVPGDIKIDCNFLLNR